MTYVGFIELLNDCLAQISYVRTDILEGIKIMVYQNNTIGSPVIIEIPEDMMEDIDDDVARGTLLELGLIHEANTLYPVKLNSLAIEEGQKN